MAKVSKDTIGKTVLVKITDSDKDYCYANRYELCITFLSLNYYNHIKFFFIKRRFVKNDNKTAFIIDDTNI